MLKGHAGQGDACRFCNGFDLSFRVYRGSTLIFKIIAEYTEDGSLVLIRWHCISKVPHKKAPGIHPGDSGLKTG